MRHIDKKTKFAGANQASPPIFRPPKLGEMQYGASYSFLETLDLISDGPIQGLVNKNAEVVNGPDLLQGIYLNETPVQVSLEGNLSKVNVADTSSTQANITGDITLANFFEHLNDSNPNDLIFEPTGQVTNFTGKAGLVAPDWKNYNVGNVAASLSSDPVWTSNTSSFASNGFIYGGATFRQDEVKMDQGQLQGTCVSVKNDFPKFGLFMGPEFGGDETNFNEKSADVKLINQSGVKSVLERDTKSTFNGNDGFVTFAKTKDYLVYSDLTDISKSINTTNQSFGSGGTITFLNGVYTLTDRVNGSIREVDNTKITNDGTEIFRVEFTIFDYVKGGIKVRAPFNMNNADAAQGNGTFSFTALGDCGDEDDQLSLQLTSTSTFKIKDIFIYNVNENEIPTNYKSLFAFGTDKNSLTFNNNSHGENEVDPGGVKYFGKGDKSSSSMLSQILSSEFLDLVSLKESARNITANLYQVNLVDKALNNLGDFIQKNNGDTIINSQLNKDWKEAFTNFLNNLDKDIFLIYKPLETQAGLDFNILDPDGPTKNVDGFDYKSIVDYSFAFQTVLGNDLINSSDNRLKVFDFLVPAIDLNGDLQRKVHGFYLIAIKSQHKRSTTLLNRGSSTTKGQSAFRTRKVGIDQDIVKDLKRISSFKYKQTDSISTVETIKLNKKFNYSNVLAELKLGTENQDPFKFFNKIYIDKPYDSFLYGPYRVNPEFKVQRIKSDSKSLSEFEFNTTISEDSIEGSTDLRTGKPISNQGSVTEIPLDRTNFLNYSDWADGLNPNFDELSSPVTHTVYNPNIEEVFVTLDIKELKDTLHTEIKPVVLANEDEEAARKLGAGVNYPALLEVRISTGLIDPKTNKKTQNGEVRDYHFVALVNSSVLVDLGNPESSPTDFPWVKLDSFKSSSTESKISTPIKLPPAIRVGTAGVGEGNEEVPHRYVEVEKISCETSSVLLTRSVSLSKVTEIIPVNLSYPFSAIIGTKLDSRSIDGVPTRNFDCKLKLIKIPSNYHPTQINGQDKRYYRSVDEFNNTPENDKIVYDGDWDGTFHEELRWTDNPAWILYDLLTNKRYGLGEHVNEDTINIWELYKIGRFCDAVDDDGFFVGVSDGQGGLEPRFACNVMFSNNEKIYDAIYTIAALFRGSIFFGDNQINFVDDRPRSPICLITNESVKGGMFNYSNNKRDEIFNTVEITYNDRFDNFLPKIETIEDEEDIRRRGVFKTRIQGVGMTSRGMARRAAAHLLFHKVNENQTITFQAGLASLLYRPGDVIEVQDELKSNLINFGRVLAVDADKQEIRISNTFDNTQMSGRLTIFNPTGIDTITDLNTIAQKNRERTTSSFNISGDLASSSSTAVWTANFTGNYDFSGYRQGYTGTEGGFEEYATYTGTGSNILYFDTTLTGWVFATGNTFERHNDFAKFISATTTIEQNTKLQNFSTGDLKNYDTSASNNRGSNTFDLKDTFSGDFINESFTNGILESEIDVNSPSQIDVITITGSTVNQAYGTLVSGVQASKANLLQNIKVGSPCSFQKSGASPITYKVLEIAEVNTNEFATVATLYESGKYDLIENDKSIITLSNTFSYQNASSQINDLIYHNLSPVRSLTFSTGDVPEVGQFFISGSWTDPNGSNATGYGITLFQNNASTSTTTENTFILFSGLSEQVGTYSLRVKALGAGVDNSLALNAYYDSTFAVHNEFLVPEEGLNHDKSFLENFTIN